MCGGGKTEISAAWKMKPNFELNIFEFTENDSSFQSRKSISDHQWTMLQTGRFLILLKKFRRFDHFENIRHDEYSTELRRTE